MAVRVAMSPFEEEGQHQRRAGGAGCQTGEHKDAGADHGTDPDHGDVKQPQITTQANFHLLIVHSSSRPLPYRRGFRATS